MGCWRSVLFEEIRVAAIVTVHYRHMKVSIGGGITRVGQLFTRSCWVGLQKVIVFWATMAFSCGCLILERSIEAQHVHWLLRSKTCHTWMKSALMAFFVGAVLKPGGIASQNHVVHQTSPKLLWSNEIAKANFTDDIFFQSDVLFPPDTVISVIFLFNQDGNEPNSEMMDGYRTLTRCTTEQLIETPCAR